MWRRSIDRPAQLLAIVLVGVCVVSLAVITIVTQRDVDRLGMLQQQVGNTDRIRLLAQRVTRSFSIKDGRKTSVDPVLLAELRSEIEDVRAGGLALDDRTDARLARIAQILDTREPLDRDQLESVVHRVNEIFDAETAAQSALWERIDEDTHLELETVIALCIVLPLLALLAAILIRRRILSPLNDLQGLLSRLADGDFRVWSAEDIHPALAPVILNYNHLVSRLAVLEEEHRTRAQLLESEVRSATETLMEQQSTLAHAERLAAAGVTTASLAHELRNPLAGVLMGLGNLRREASDGDFIERLDLVIAEIERLTRMLNSALAESQHAPEPSRQLNLRELVRGLLALLRYQVPDHVDLVCEVPDDIECSLPRDRLRQALLNLVINSVRAIRNDSGRVTIRAVRRDGQIELSVEDDGPGFPDQLLASGIRPFFTGIGGGTGLGLAIVRRVAVDLGGEVQLKNLDPRGACVRLVVPCADG